MILWASHRLRSVTTGLKMAAQQWIWPHFGSPSTCYNDKVIAKLNVVVMWDCCVTVQEIAEWVGVWVLV